MVWDLPPVIEMPQGHQHKMRPHILELQQRQRQTLWLVLLSLWPASIDIRMQHICSQLTTGLTRKLISKGPGSSGQGKQQRLQWIRLRSRMPLRHSSEIKNTPEHEGLYMYV